MDCVVVVEWSSSPAQGVFSSEAWRQRALLKWVVDGCGLSEQVAHCHAQT